MTDSPGRHGAYFDIEAAAARLADGFASLEEQLEAARMALREIAEEVWTSDVSLSTDMRAIARATLSMIDAKRPGSDAFDHASAVSNPASEPSDA